MIASRHIAVLLCVLLAGCSAGPVTVPLDRFNYNQAGAQSTKEQLLLNIVRLRYREPIYVLEIGSIIGSHTYNANASFSGWWNNINELENPALMAIYGNDKHPSRQNTYAAGLSYTDSPTITYLPVEGEKFADRMMTPIPQATIFQLSQSGWGIDQLLECCVQRVNGISNAPIAGVRDVNRSADPRFDRVATLLREVQDAGMLVFVIESNSAGAKSVYLRADPDPHGMEGERRELKELLGYSGERLPLLKLVPAPFKTKPDELAMQTRSLVAVMWALSCGVEVPDDHIERRWADPCTTCGQEDGETRWLRVRSSALPRCGAFVQVFYKGRWFSIDECDAESKRTFALLDYLFSLQQTEKSHDLPVITVPAK